MRGKGRKKKEGRGWEGRWVATWTCFLPGRATPSGGVGVGVGLSKLCSLF